MKLGLPIMTINPIRMRAIVFAIVYACLTLPACAAGAQAKASSGPWTGIITATVKTSEPGFSFESEMNCDLKASSVVCTYKSTMKISGTVPSVITESATQDHLQVSIFKRSGEWLLRVAAFMSTGTKTITANGQTRSGNGINIQAPDWEVPIPEPRDPNRSSGTWQNSSGGTIKWELSR
jgi:hypothetical protein